MQKIFSFRITPIAHLANAAGWFKYSAIIFKKTAAVFMAMLLMFSAAMVNAQTTSITITCTGIDGSFRSGSTNGDIKNDGNLINLNSTASGSRGWATFDLTVIPDGSIIESAKVNFTTYSSGSSPNSNEIHGFTADPSTLSSADLYNAIGPAGLNVISAPSPWSTTTNSKTFNANGVSFLQSNIKSNKVNVGFVKSGAGNANYNVSGYPGTDGAKPALIITYNLPSVPPPCAMLIFPSAGKNTLVPVTGGLSWLTAATATAYDVYLGPSPTPGLVAALSGPATSYTFNPVLTPNTTYYYKIVPKNIAGDAIDCVVQSFTTSPMPAYCLPPPSDCSKEEVIVNVTFAGINNTSSVCSNSGYTDYSGYVAAPVIPVLQTLPVSVKIGGSSNNYVGVWIDFDASGTFDANEFTDLGNGTNTVITANVNIPGNAAIGYTKMRVRLRFDAALAPGDACNPYLTDNYGETEDYTINISSCLLPVINNLSGDTVICKGGTAKFFIKDGALNNGTKWQWYTGICGGTAAGMGDTLNVKPDTSTTYYLRGEGGCVTPVVCKTVTVTVNEIPFPPTITPVTPICINSVQALEVPGSLPPGPGYTTVVSEPLAIQVPDNISTGATTSLAVSVPFGAFATSMSVKLNLTHTFPGDMIINLKAPNGKILNLYKYNTALFGDNPVSDAGWYDAEINSTDTTTFGYVPSPYRYGITNPKGPYRPDAINYDIIINNTKLDVQNPVGYISNAASFADLYSQLSGNWTLAMADGGPNDLGLLKNWSITINYVIPKGYPAIWSPASSLYTDEDATVPYDGVTPLFKVYAKPALTTTYTATSVNGPCVSASSTNVTVTVNNPISDVTNPADITVCESLNAVFETSAKGTDPVFQWLVNTGDGIYSAINDGANYDGTHTDSLTVKKIPFAWNGYKYRCKVSSQVPCATFDTTAAAVLSVNPTPVVTLMAAPSAKLLPGFSTVLTAGSVPAATSYTWFKNDVTVAGASSASLNVSVDLLGNYTARVTDIYGCINTSAPLAVTDSVSARLFVFPNPAVNGIFQVRYHSALGNVLPRTIMMYNASGQLVYNKKYIVTKSYDKMEVNMHSMNRGVYIINLLDANGKRLAVGKIMVQ